MVKLATERKHLTDIIKMVAYQTESDLLALLRPHYARVDQEGRTLLHELFATAGDIRVCGSELRITLAPQLTAHAAEALCEMLDQTATIFPGSRLRLRFAMHPPPRIGLAFPGSPVERSTAVDPLRLEESSACPAQSSLRQLDDLIDALEVVIDANMNEGMALLYCQSGCLSGF